MKKVNFLSFFFLLLITLICLPLLSRVILMLLLFMRRNREYMFQSLHFTVTVVRAFKATLLCSFSEICFYFTYAQLCQKHTRLYRAQDHLNRLRSVAKDSMSADRSFFIHYYCISVYVPSLLSAASHHVVCFRVSPS